MSQFQNMYSEGGRWGRSKHRNGGTQSSTSHVIFCASKSKKHEHEVLAHHPPLLDDKLMNFLTWISPAVSVPSKRQRIKNLHFEVDSCFVWLKSSTVCGPLWPKCIQGGWHIDAMAHVGAWCPDSFATTGNCKKSLCMFACLGVAHFRTWMKEGSFSWYRYRTDVSMIFNVTCAPCRRLQSNFRQR